MLERRNVHFKVNPEQVTSSTVPQPKNRSSQLFQRQTIRFTSNRNSFDIKSPSPQYLGHCSITNQRNWIHIPLEPVYFSFSTTCVHIIHKALLSNLSSCNRINFLEHLASPSLGQLHEACCTTIPHGHHLKPIHLPRCPNFPMSPKHPSAMLLTGACLDLVVGLRNISREPILLMPEAHSYVPGIIECHRPFGQYSIQRQSSSRIFQARVSDQPVWSSNTGRMYDHLDWQVVDSSTPHMQLSMTNLL